MMVRVFISIISIFLFSIYSIAQISFVEGANYCNVRNDNLIKNQKPILSLHFGPSLTMYPFKKLPDFSFRNDFLFIQKGYKQELDSTYNFRFNYFSWTMLSSYDICKILSVHAGVEFSGLLFTNVRRGVRTYNRVDVGLILGFDVNVCKRISFYSRIDYGLVPMLDYYSFDKLGNFTGEIHDLKNICLLAGIKIKFRNEKINLFK